MAKKIIRRPAPPKPKPSERAKLPSGWTEALVRACSCGRMTVTWEGEIVVISGPGQMFNNQWAVCGGCKKKIRVAPIVAWEGSSGARYTTGNYVDEGSDRRVEIP